MIHRPHPATWSLDVLHQSLSYKRQAIYEKKLHNAKRCLLPVPTPPVSLSLGSTLTVASVHNAVSFRGEPLYSAVKIARIVIITLQSTDLSWVGSGFPL